MRPCKIICYLVIVLFIAGCAAKIEKAVEKPVEKAKPPLVLIPPENVPSFNDDLKWESLDAAIGKSIRYYDTVVENITYGLGNDRVSARDMKESLLVLKEIINGTDSDNMKQEKMKDAFDVYKATGSDNKGSVLFTGYFEPVMEGSLEKTEIFRYPIYRTPDDAVAVNLGKFRKKYSNERIIGRVKNGELIPYFTRADIDSAGSLKGKKLELVWVDDPVDLFFLHIQGSGKIKLSDGRYIQVSYAQSNGRTNRMTNYLIDKGKLSKSQMTHQAVKKYLREHPEELSDIFNYNESYVFFRIVEEGPVGALGLTLTAARSIATDLDLFPKGALAFIRLRKPIFDDNGNIKTWKSFSRFVLNQDTGGVIKGPGRVDLFCGTGSDTEKLAGSLKEKGELYFLVRKKGLRK
ncbi:MAG: MltA domain-containing protein [Deltaproteobacteria bacterium]|nr:MltA domain-containing protein [Deltaproteobacteria bacterium]